MTRLLRDWRTRLTLLLAVVGPGFITANVDNDAGFPALYKPGFNWQVALF